MIYHDLISFKKGLSPQASFNCLIIMKEGEERAQALRIALQVVQRPSVSFYPDTFSLKDFLQEVHTFPLLAPNKVVVLYDIDQLNNEALESIYSYATNPSSWITLLMTAASLNSKLVKEVEKNGTLLRCKEEKPWEKEKRLAEWVIQEAANAGVRINLTLAQMFVKSVEASCLKNELEKLICFAGEKREITQEAIKKLSSFTSHETLWQLGDAIFESSFSKAAATGRALLEGGMVLIPLIAHLRGQINTGMQILQAYQNGGSGAVTASFPYLKGGLLEKKLNLLRSYGSFRMQKAMIHLFEVEVRAKNSAADPHLLLEILVAKLTNDTLSITKSDRTCC